MYPTSHLYMARTNQSRRLEKSIATMSFIVAVALSFTSMFLSSDYDIAANVCLVVAQFLTLTATLLGIDYHFTSNHGAIKFTTGNPEQKPPKPTEEQ